MMSSYVTIHIPHSGKIPLVKEFDGWIYEQLSDTQKDFLKDRTWEFYHKISSNGDHSFKSVKQRIYLELYAETGHDETMAYLLFSSLHLTN